MPKPLAKFCLFTIRSPEWLDENAKLGGVVPFEVGQRMVTAKTLFAEAKDAEEDFAVLFGAATYCSDLIYWARLISIKPRDSDTRIKVVSIRKLPRVERTQELVLRSSGKCIAEGYIRPYAICKTPPFLTPKKRKSQIEQLASFPIASPHVPQALSSGSVRAADLVPPRSWRGLGLTRDG